MLSKVKLTIRSSDALLITYRKQLALFTTLLTGFLGEAQTWSIAVILNVHGLLLEYSGNKQLLDILIVVY